MQYTTTTSHTTHTAACRLEQWLTGAGIVLALALVALLFAQRGLLPGFGSAESPAPDALTTKNMAFGRTTLHTRAGQPLTLALANGDGYGHSFDIDELDVHVPMPAARNAAVTFTPDAPGSYTFYCGVPGHREAGMVGTLIVEP